MKTLQEFEQYLESDKDLTNDINTLESQRKSSSKMFIYMTAAIVVIIAIAIFYYTRTILLQETPNTAEEAIAAQNKNNNVVYYFIFGALGIYGLSFVFRMVTKNKAANASASAALGSNGLSFDFKDKVIRRMVNFWDPSFRYQINNHVKKDEILQSGMLYPKNYTVSGGDMIQGEVEGVNFKFSDIHVLTEKKYTQKNEDPYETVLYGSFFMADFNKEFKSPVYVYPAKFMGINSLDAVQHEGEKVHLEDPEFTKKFNVYSTDQIEARYILTPSMMERIKSLCSRMGNNVYFVFANSRVYIANHNGKNRFETSFFKSVSKNETLISYFNELSEQLSIIHELKLNINIWTNKTEG